MRRFRDSNGADWDVIVGRASWGAFQALFVPVDGGTVRQAPLGAVSQIAAEGELAAFSTDELARLFDASRPRET